MTRLNCICQILFFTLKLNMIYGQPDYYSARKEAINSQINRLSQIEDSVFSSRKDLINGKLYYQGGDKFIHPFYGDNTWVPAGIYSSGKVIEFDLAKYDLYVDYLVILYNDQSLSFPLYMNKEFVKEFIIKGHHLKYLENFEGSAVSELIPGYYEIQYDGKTKALIRRSKLKQFDDAQLSDVFSNKIFFFVKKDGKYFRVIRQKNLFDVLKDHKKEIKTYMKKNKMRFSPDNYEVIGKVLDYYDTL
jgi:hypothetical protein